MSQEVIISFDLDEEEDYIALVNSLDLIPFKIIKVPKEWEFDDE